MRIFAITSLTILLLIGAGYHGSSSDLAAKEPQLLQLSGDISVHDPSIIKADGVYYVFCTGGGRGGGIIPIRRSTDLINWTRSGSVFTVLPDWAKAEMPLAHGIWAPDISFFNGKYYLYYAISSFGVNDSAIGLAVNETLDPSSPRYKWVDQGLVLRSHPHIDDFNAIDPTLVIEDMSNVWLCWGSFWSGLKIRRIDPTTGKLSTTDTHLYSVARRPRRGSAQTPPVEGAIEAPTVVRRGNYWYLFASYDFCCRGANSTYNVKVGRSDNVTGPYVDRDGKPLTEDGGTPVVPAITQLWNGAGGQTVFNDGDQYYIVFHSYDKQTGRSRLQISTLAWDDDWPRMANVPQ
jgi:arabinan endo-1,5-alpha-L-arabinosidase